MKKLFSRFTRFRQSERQVSPFYSVGFHGDQYLLEFAGRLLKDANVFIETGTNVGTTLAYVARAYPHLRCISCEPDLPAFIEAIKHTNDLSNVFLFNESSQQFTAHLYSRFGSLLDGRTVFWLDAHGYGFEWPLRDEIAYITANFSSAYILIDDFKVPGLDMFGYDQYNGQICSFEYIQPSLNQQREYSLYYPAYTEKTSAHHPLRGWGLIRYGDDAPFSIPDDLIGKIRMAEK